MNGFPIGKRVNTPRIKKKKRRKKLTFIRHVVHMKRLFYLYKVIPLRLKKQTNKKHDLWYHDL